MVHRTQQQSRSWRCINSNRVWDHLHHFLPVLPIYYNVWLPPATILIINDAGMTVRKPMEQATSEDFFNIIDLMVKNTDGSLLSQDSMPIVPSISKFGTTVIR